MSHEHESGRDQEKSRRGATRRTFLRGAGVTMTLPWLESLPVWARLHPRRPPRRRLRNDSPPCSWAAAYTRTSGRPRDRAPRWSWDGALNL